jgi:hypothetical protein
VIILANDKQVSYYNNLCEELGQDADEDFDSLSIYEAGKVIAELKQMVQERKNKFEGKEDDCYWY